MIASLFNTTQADLLSAYAATPKPVTKHFKKWTGTKWRQVTEIKEPLRTALQEENQKLYLIYEKELHKYGIENIPHAYRKNHSIRTNAAMHKNNKRIVKFDFSKFYDTVKWKYIKPYILLLHPELEKEEVEYKKCFIDKDTNGVYQGGPCSGTLAGLALIPFWRELKKALPNETFTQYSDDLIISNTDKTEAQLQKIIIQCLKKAKRHFYLNKKKTCTQINHFRTITGVHVNRNNQTTPKRKDYRRYKALLHGLSKTDNPVLFLECIGETPSHFLGKLSYLQSIDETGKINTIITKSQDSLEIIKSEMIKQQTQNIGAIL